MVITGDLNVTKSAKLMGAIVIIDGNLFSQATEEISLSSGRKLLIYIKDPTRSRLINKGKGLYLDFNQQS